MACTSPCRLTSTPYCCRGWCAGLEPRGSQSGPHRRLSARRGASPPWRHLETAADELAAREAEAYRQGLIRSIAELVAGLPWSVRRPGRPSALIAGPPRTSGVDWTRVRLVSRNGLTWGDVDWCVGGQGAFLTGGGSTCSPSLHGRSAVFLSQSPAGTADRLLDWELAASGGPLSDVVKPPAYCQRCSFGLVIASPLARIALKARTA